MCPIGIAAVILGRRKALNFSSDSNHERRSRIFDGGCTKQNRRSEQVVTTTGYRKLVVKMPEVSVQAAKGWYVRGDVGYAVNASRSDTTFRAYDPAGGDYDSGHFDSNRFGGDFFGGLGIGYQFNDLFRADVTGDFFTDDLASRRAAF